LRLRNVILKLEFKKYFLYKFLLDGVVILVGGFSAIRLHIFKN
jgi:hypothetical protein